MEILQFLIFTFIAFNGCGQDYLLDKYENTYFHERKEYEWKELGDVYMECEEAFNIYSIGRKKLNSAKNFAVVGAVTMGMGIITLILGPSGYRLIYGDVVLIYGILVEFISAIILVKGKNKMI